MKNRDDELRTKAEGLMTRREMFLVVALPAVHAVTLAASQSTPRLDARIPAALPDKYKGIHDAREFLNPKLLVSPDRINVLALGLPAGGTTVQAGELQKLLIDLPIQAWPYGRVVWASDNGLRKGDGSDEQPLRRNHEAVVRILEALEIKAEWLPSA